MIDTTTGSFAMRSRGRPAAEPDRHADASSPRSGATRLWTTSEYTVYETLDPNTYSNPSNYQDCATLLRNGRPSHCTRIDWITGDMINGPMFTQDQYSICGAPVFGRSGAGDLIATAAPSNGTYSANGCSNNVVLNAPISLGYSGANPPTDNAALLADAQADGKVYSGTTTDHAQRHHGHRGQATARRARST